jgi:MFS family permease
MLGLTLFAGQFPTFLFTLIGGVASDRLSRYRVLLTTQFLSMIQASILAFLVIFTHYQVWEIITMSVFLGLINAFDVPARQSLVNEMVEDKKDLPNAIALNSSMVNLSRLIGPAIAGIALEKLGNGICFALNALSFLAVIISLLLMKLAPEKIKKDHSNVFEELRNGFVYVRSNPFISQILFMLALTSLMILPFNTLIPVYAKEIFHGTASTFGIIDSFVGIGAFSGALFLASLKSKIDLNWILFLDTLLFGIGLILFSHETHYFLALVFAILVGFGMMLQVTISNTQIQTTVSQEMRGRVISFYALAFFGMMPIGGLIVGTISQHIGTPNTILWEGIICLLLAGLRFYFLKGGKRFQEELKPVKALADELIE